MWRPVWFLTSALVSPTRKKIKKLKATPNIDPCDLWHLRARIDGDSGHPFISWPLSHPKGGHAGPLPQSSHWLGLRDLVVWTKSTEGGEGMWDGGHAKSDGWWSHSPVWGHFERDQLNSQRRRGHDHQQQEQIRCYRRRKWWKLKKNLITEDWRKSRQLLKVSIATMMLQPMCISY